MDTCTDILKEEKSLTEKEKADLLYYYFAKKLDLGSLHRDSLIGFKKNDISTQKHHIDPSERANFYLSASVYDCVFHNLFSILPFNYLEDKKLSFSQSELENSNGEENPILSKNNDFNKLLLKKERNCFILSSFLFKIHQRTYVKRSVDHQKRTSKKVFSSITETPILIHTNKKRNGDQSPKKENKKKNKKKK